MSRPTIIRNQDSHYQNIFQIYLQDIRLHQKVLHTIDSTFKLSGIGNLQDTYDSTNYTPEQQLLHSSKYQYSGSVNDFIHCRSKISSGYSSYSQQTKIKLQHLGSFSQKTTTTTNVRYQHIQHSLRSAVIVINIAFKHFAIMAPVMSTNRFAALMNEAKNPTPVSASPMTNPPPPAVVSPSNHHPIINEEDEGPWLLAPVKRNATNRKKNLKGQNKNLQQQIVQVPKTLPAQISTKAHPTGNEPHKFAMDCRIKVLAHESVNPSRLVQAVLTIFQHAEPATVLTTSMYNAKDCPTILDPLTMPKTESTIAPFLSSWKKIRDDLFLCRIHMMSTSPFDMIKKDPQVLEYLKKELIIVERATLDSSDHQLIGFLVNVVPDQDSLSAQQYRFEKILQDVPGFQLVTRKLNFKENSKLWCNVLKIRVDRADADDLTLAFQAVSLKSHDFQYYAFDQFTSLHPDQKRYIIETQRNFVQQNRSIVIDWPIREVSHKFVMWLEEDDQGFECESDDDIEDMFDEDLTNTPKRVNTSSAKNQRSIQGSCSKRTHEDSVQTDSETTGPEPTKLAKQRTLTPMIYNNVDLRKVGIDEFLYSYRCGDGSPLIKYIYPEADGRRELLTSRTKRAEVNSFIKVLFQELARHMSAQSRVEAFDNPDEIYQEGMNASPWSPSGLHTMVPFSTTPTSKSSSNKRRITSTNVESNVKAVVPTTVVNTTSDTGTSSSSITDRSLSGTSATNSTYNTTLITQQEELNSVKAQLGILQQQHTNLYQTVKQMAQQNSSDKKEIQQTIEQSQSALQSYVAQTIDHRANKMTSDLQAQYSESINQLRNETLALDKHQTEARNQLKTEVSSEVSAAIAALTTVVAKIELGQSNLIQHLSVGKEQETRVQNDQIAMFLDNVTATGATVDVRPTTDTQTSPSSATNNTVTPTTQNTMGSLPSTIGRVAMTTLTGLNKRSGRGGGRELRQQTLTSSTKQNLSGQHDTNISSVNHSPPTSNIALTSTHTPPNAIQHQGTGSTGNHHT